MVTIQEKDDVILGDGGGGVAAVAVREVASTQPKHIRPTVRGKTKTTSTTISSSVSSDNNAGKTNSNSDGNVMVEETRIKMDSWMGLKGGTKQQQPTAANADDVQHGQPLDNKKKQNETKSILKKPKYSAKPMESVGIPTGGGGGGAAAAAAAAASGTYKEKKSEVDDRGGQGGSSSTNFAAASGGRAICKSFVVERDPSIAPLKKKRSGTKVRTDNNTTTTTTTSSFTIKANDLVGNNQRHNSIEGYVPASSNPSNGGSVAAGGTSAAARSFGVAGTATGTVTDADGQQAAAAAAAATATAAVVVVFNATFLTTFLMTGYHILKLGKIVRIVLIGLFVSPLLLFVFILPQFLLLILLVFLVRVVSCDRDGDEEDHCTVLFCSVLE